MVVVGQGVKEIDVLGERFVSGTKHMMRGQNDEGTRERNYKETYMMKGL